MPTPPLDPQVEAYLHDLRAAGVRPLHELSVVEAREADAELADLEPVLPERVTQVVDRVLLGPGHDVPVRVYLPEAPRPLPVLVYFFGGGWVLGSLDAVDPVCRRLANATPCAVVSVAYRRAPENPFPAGLEDCYAALCWVAEHGAELGLDSARLAVGGASAGGNLAAAVALLARERREPKLVLQLLVYPPLDHRADTRSTTETLDPLLFGREDLAWCWSHYLAEPADGDSTLASPLRAQDLRGLPAALVITAELDPLRDQGELYAARLGDAGVPVNLMRFEGAVHGFFSKADRFDAGTEAQALAASALRLAFEPLPSPSDETSQRIFEPGAYLRDSTRSR
jgi:acetyl esterase